MKINGAFVLALFVTGLANASSLPDYPFIFETGSAEVGVAPDMANVDLTISSRGRDALKAFSTVNGSVTAVLDMLAKSKVPAADIDSSEIQRSVDFSQGVQDKAAPTHYVISRHVKVLLRDLTVWPALMTDLAKVENIESLNSEFQTSARKSLEAELELKAVHDAEARAKRIAESVGRKLGPVMAVSRVPLNGLERTFMEGDSTAFAPPPPYIPPAESNLNLRVPARITLSKSLNVLFKLD